MPDDDTLSNLPSEVISAARAAEHAIQQVCRDTLTRPSMTPAEVDIVLAHLAETVAALPQATRQLGDILAQAKDDHALEIDTLTDIEEPDMAIDAARLHLDGVGEAALGLYRMLDAAHNETAHIAVADRLAKNPEEHAQDITPLASRGRSACRRREAGDPLWLQTVAPQVRYVGSPGGEPLRGSETAP